MTIYGFNPLGGEDCLVYLELDIRRGLPVIDMVGMPGMAVREARERIRAAACFCQLALPVGRVLINIAPSAVPKGGASLDLALAMGVLSAGLPCLENDSRKVLIMGELGLAGKVHSSEGVLHALIEAKRQGIEYCIVPRSNAIELSAMPLDYTVMVDTLAEAFEAIKQMLVGQTLPSTKLELSKQAQAACLEPSQLVRSPSSILSFSVLDQDPILKLGVLAAAAGAHNTLFFGPPGVGKSMLMETVGHLLPALDPDEVLEVNRIYSRAGKLNAQRGLIRTSPCRKPHHTSSTEALVGGGKPPRPGEISLAHRGALILDEAAEYSRGSLQSLREPLELGRISVGRVDNPSEYPACFQLLMAINCCPCGSLGSLKGTCACSVQEVKRYWARLGGALIDRIDLRLSVGMPDFGLSRLGMTRQQIADLSKHYPLPTSFFELSQKVETARERQRRRKSAGAELYLRNQDLKGLQVETIARVSESAVPQLEALNRCMAGNRRALHGVLRVARTLADLNGSQDLSSTDILMADALRAGISPAAGIEIHA